MGRGIFKLYTISCLFLGGCATNLHVDLVESQILNVAHEDLGLNPPNSNQKKTSKFIKFKIVANENLLEYYTFDRNFPINLVCEATAFERKENLRSSGFGPFHNGIDISKILLPNSPNRKKIKRNGSGRYEYSIYSFINLEAGFTQLHHGVPETALKLESEEFESVGCIISGIAYPPFIPPRSNRFEVSKTEFRKMLRSYYEAVE